MAKRRTIKQKTASKKVATIGSKIMKEAKKIRAKHPGKKWTTCVKEAGKAYKRNH